MIRVPNKPTPISYFQCKIKKSSHFIAGRSRKRKKEKHELINHSVGSSILL
jgi:hypothetical protein